jgi:hypothetical protein
LGFGYIMLVRYRTRRAAGLIVPSTVVYTPPDDDLPVAAVQDRPTAPATTPDAESETDRLYA